MNRLFLTIIPILSVPGTPLPVLLASILLVCSCGCSSKPGTDATFVDRTPELYPRMDGATLPWNIAPPTFVIRQEADRYHTTIGLPDDEGGIVINSSSAEVVPGEGKWHKLLEKAKGGEIAITVSTLSDGHWTTYAPVLCPVSEYPIDSNLVYRLLYPGYELWNEMGIYQRDLTGYEESPVIENSEIGQQCINCHSFVKNDPRRLMLHVRGPKGGTLIASGDSVRKVNPKCPELPHGATYPAWHPSGGFIAFSANEIRQFFHTSGTKIIEVSDLGADMSVYDVTANKSVAVPTLTGEEWMETFPNWSPDGSTLWFCRARGYREGDRLEDIRYDLCRIPFDTVSCEFGTPETVYNASADSASVSFPRMSPDGRWLLFTRSDYGNFSIWHPESDLWLMDMSDLSIRPVEELNSPDVDSYHSWSSDGRWVVFSSKRMDGQWARPFIASFDTSTGRFGRPFVLPQKSPMFYDNFTRTYNLPEFTTSPVTSGPILSEVASRAN